MHQPPADLPSVRPAEQLLLELLAAGKLAGAGRMLCNSAGRGQFALAWARENPAGEATCFFLDLYQQRQAAEAGKDVAEVRFVCQSDLPGQEVDLVALALSRQGDAELTRELLQQGHERLAIGGQLVATTDNPRDAWVHDRMRDLFPKVSRCASASGAAYLATKHVPLRKLKDYACEFAFRDGERLIHLRTRPGVFSHRSLDGGARSLIQAISIPPAARVLDLGCGSGAVGLAAAGRNSQCQVVAIDANPRAVECTRWGAATNGLRNLSAELDCDGGALQGSSFDLVLANPPYYSNFRLARLFAEVAHRALREGGVLQAVTKTPDWYAEHLPPRFDCIEFAAAKSYVVVSARKS